MKTKKDDFLKNKHHISVHRYKLSWVFFVMLPFSIISAWYFFREHSYPYDLTLITMVILVLTTGLAVILLLSTRVIVFEDGIGRNSILENSYIYWEEVSCLKVSYSLLVLAYSFPFFEVVYNFEIEIDEGSKMFRTTSAITDNKVFIRELKKLHGDKNIEFRTPVKLFEFEINPEKFWESI